MEKERMQHLTIDETELLFREIYRERGIHRKRNIAIFEVAKYCALRASEVANLRVSYYDRHAKQIYCPRLKGSNSNTLKIVNAHVIKALEDYLDERTARSIESPYLFVSQKGNPISRQRLDALIKHFCKKAQYIYPSKWHMHVLKHTRAIELAELDFDIDDIQFWLGHKNAENTFKYLEFTISLRKRMFHRLSTLEGGSYTERYTDEYHQKEE